MRGGNCVHARIKPGEDKALCGAQSLHGLMYGTNTFKDGGPDMSVTCKNCLSLIAHENDMLRAGVEML